MFGLVLSNDYFSLIKNCLVRQPMSLGVWLVTALCAYRVYCPNNFRKSTEKQNNYSSLVNNYIIPV